MEDRVRQNGEPNNRHGPQISGVGAEEQTFPYLDPDVSLRSLVDQARMQVDALIVEGQMLDTQSRRFLATALARQVLGTLPDEWPPEVARRMIRDSLLVGIAVTYIVRGQQPTPRTLTTYPTTKIGSDPTAMGSGIPSSGEPGGKVAEGLTSPGFSLTAGAGALKPANAFGALALV
jgi:hypothetical protein